MKPSTGDLVVRYCFFAVCGVGVSFICFLAWAVVLGAKAG